MPYSPHVLRCVYCSRVLHKHNISDSSGRRFLLVSKNAVTGSLTATDRIYLVCEGECDRALRTSLGRSDYVETRGVDFFPAVETTLLPAWEALCDAVYNSKEWINRWSSYVKSGAVEEADLPMLRLLAKLIKEAAAEAYQIEKSGT